MSYLGNSPPIGQYRKLDNLVFNGVQTTFAMTIDGVSVTPPTAFAMMVVLNGVTQNPGVNFSISAADLSFAVAPVALTPFFALIFGDTLYTGTPSDGTVTDSKIAVGTISYNKFSSVTQARLTANQIIFGV